MKKFLVLLVGTASLIWASSTHSSISAKIKNSDFLIDQQNAYAVFQRDVYGLIGHACEMPEDGIESKKILGVRFYHYTIDKQKRFVTICLENLPVPGSDFKERFCIELYCL